MGDDTWMSVFPDCFHPNMTFPYDSFNVEDLHSVDEGVIRHLFPLLEDETKPFDFLIGHFLGVDHVGHRVGPDHPSMKLKLGQMNDVLTRVVELLDDETILMVLGDHGMDRSGDHGGDGELETSAGVWIYSKGPPISSNIVIPPVIGPQVTFPGAFTPHRYIQQIDLVPTLSLLLGLPIPFNNLGSVIPELFWRDPSGTLYDRALAINARQVNEYLDKYRASPSGGELDEGWPMLQGSWAAVESASANDAGMIALHEHIRLALSVCRSMWAQFDVVVMNLGLALLGLGVIATWALYEILDTTRVDWDAWLYNILAKLLHSTSTGAVIGLVSAIPLRRFIPGLRFFESMFLGALVVSSLVFIVPALHKFSLYKLRLGAFPLILILHSIAFTSNSFTFWEDRIVLFLLMSSIVPSVLKAISAPTPRLRNRILRFSLLFAVCVRLMATSTICREEQQPYCDVTFFSSSTVPSPPLLALILALPTAIALPYAIQRFLRISKSDRGTAAFFLPWLLRSALCGGSLYWLLEWAEVHDILGAQWSSVLRALRTVLARLSMGSMTIGGFVCWWYAPTCLEVSVDVNASANGAAPEKQVTIIGFANSYGSPYLVFWTIPLGLLFTVTQPTGQLVLCLAAVALLAHLEVIDSVRDVEGIHAVLASSMPSAALDPDLLQSSTPTLKFSDVVPLALLGLHTFYGTGHQSTISSIQWKSAFVLSPTVTYPLSPLTVIINFFGSFFLFALAVPLLELWNRPPIPPTNVRGTATRAALAFTLYYACLLLGTATSAAVLRRHLMVWKVFAPRFMSAVAELLIVDLAVVVGVWIGVERVVARIEALFKGLEGRVQKA
jgi:GPI ethanolamine phosphate transferase 3 subunit O